MLVSVRLRVPRVQKIWPGSFTAYQGDAQRTFLELLYLSFASLTSVGLSDVTPILPDARAVVIIEQLAGVMYVALVISRLVGLTITRFRRDSQRRPASGGGDAGRRRGDAAGGPSRSSIRARLGPRVALRARAAPPPRPAAPAARCRR